MIFNAILIVLLLAIAFIHFVQGMFSATLSAIFSVLAAAVAVGFTEPVLLMLKPAKFADVGSAFVMCGLFVITYLLLRIIFDKAVPGNVRLEPTTDKVGAAIMGLVAGVMCTGIIAVATASLPFSLNLGGMYSRYALNPDKEVGGIFNPTETRAEDAVVSNATKDDAFLPNDKDTAGNADPNLNKLIIPVDDWTLGLVSDLSSGALAGDRQFAEIHPDYLQELYGQRTGIQAGARHAAPNFPGSDAVSVQGMYMLPSLPPVQDAEIKAVRSSGFDAKSLIPEKGKPLLVVRAHLAGSAADDTNNLVDFSLAAVRLVVHRTDPSTNTDKPTDIYPIGTLEDGKLWMNRMDDFLFANRGDCTIDFVFSLDDVQEVTTDAKPDSKNHTYDVQNGTLFELKKLGFLDLSGQTVTAGFPQPSKDPGVYRKVILKPPPKT